MNLEVRIPSNLVIRGRDLRTSAGSIGLGDVNLTAGGAVQVTKDAETAMRILGQVSIVRGHYSFQGRRFELESGSEIRMRGADLMDMILDLTATRQISGLEARVSVGGTLRQPQVTLSSDPPLDPGDVLSLIVFNQPVNELGESQQVSLAERAGLLAAGAVTTPLTDSVARMLDLDVFEIRQSETDSTGAVVTVGRQVTDTLFVGFRHEFGHDETSRVSFEYRLSTFLRIVTSVGQGDPNSNRIPREETAGLDLFFVIRR
jgi:translocation and assembly module TamB